MVHRKAAAQKADDAAPMMAVKEEVLDTSFEEDPESDILAMALGHPLPTKKINRKHVNDHYYSLFPGDQVEEDIKFSDTGSVVLAKDEVEDVGYSAGDAILTQRKKGHRRSSKNIDVGFPVKRLHRFLQRQTRLRVSPTSSIAMAAVGKYLVEEVLYGSVQVMKRYKRKRVTPRHIGVGVYTDYELAQVFKDIWIPSTGSFGSFYLPTNMG
ncbi:hypothetical protein Q1695_014821 [Nippostrongylus brasiliensis]|nr:hypothetical protein Q1695_014821 [Nippostrongylus brasiliensis]